MRSLILALALTSIDSAAAADNDPKATTRVIDGTKVTLIDQEAKDKPVAEILESIAKKMGYEKIVDKEGAATGLKFSCAFKKKPAWECLVEVCEKNGLLFGGAGIGEDYALGIYRPGKWRWVARPAGGLVAVFSQAPAGTPFDDPFHRPYSLRILSEPSVACTYKDVAVADQKNALGKPCSLVGLQPTGTGVQETPGKDKSDPWPGLSAFTVKGTAEVVKKKVTADVTGLSPAVASFPVNHDGKLLLTIEKIGDEGNFVKLEISAPSASTSEGVMQGGWGHPTGPAIEAAVGFRLDFADEKGVPVGPTVISWKGDGAKATVTFKFTRHLLGKAGGIGAITARFSKPLESEPVPFSIPFKDLAK